MENKFISAIKSGDLKQISQFPKSDIHSHAGKGGKREYIEQWAKTTIELPPKKFNSLDHMQQWFVENIRCLTSGVEGVMKRWEAAFKQANEDHIEVLTLSFSTEDAKFVGGMENFMDILTEYNEQLAPHTLFLPELTYDRASNVDQLVSEIDEVLSYQFFRSIDVCCNELAQPIKNFKPLYRKAKEAGLRLIAHVGEFGTADDVMEAVEELELDEVHHGIAAAKSPFVTRWLADHQIQLNICPSSNVMLNVVDDYANHPIQTLFRAGIPVTINTDDLLIFNQTISQEYLNLYEAGTLTTEELEQIRLIGLEERLKR